MIMDRLSTLRHSVLNLNFTTVTIAVLTLWVLIKLIGRKSNAPPGPWGVPVLGCLPSLFFAGKPIREVFKELSHKYGAIVSLRLGSANVVVLNDFNSVKEILTRPEFQDRIKFDVTQASVGEGIVESSGHVWQGQRKFVHHHFREFGVGKSSFENAVASEARYLTESLLEYEGKSFDLSRFINNAVSNVILSVCFGQRYHYDDRRFKNVLDHFVENTKQSLFGHALSTFLPITRYIPMCGSKKILTNMQTYFNFYDEIQAEHMANIDVNNIKDAMDAYLIEIEKAKDTELSNTFNEDNMKWTFSDIFGAGVESTKTTLLWTFLFLLNNPDVEAKVRSQLADVVGPNRLALYSDRPNLPYIEAFMSESLRLGAASSISIPHVASSNATLQGFSISKGTIIIPNLYALFTDESKWKDAYVFRPERFLDENGNFVKREDFIPFSAGRRVCLGEQLARMELFIFLTHIMQQMVFTIPEGTATPTTEGIEGIAYHSQPYQVHITKIL